MTRKILIECDHCGRAAFYESREEFEKHRRKCPSEDIQAKVRK